MSQAIQIPQIGYTANNMAIHSFLIASLFVITSFTLWAVVLDSKDPEKKGCFWSHKLKGMEMKNANHHKPLRIFQNIITTINNNQLEPHITHLQRLQIKSMLLFIVLENLALVSMKNLAGSNAAKFSSD
ncbi:hypothetical protein BC833DRAFT_567270 [Globomyces pollinis-pini]|nr:hypothetical protein BC833DRAFT_567270 [Globomyces pollinis-pini]